MLFAIRTLSVLLFFTLVGDGHLQHYSNLCQPQFLVLLQIFILAVTLLPPILKVSAFYRLTSFAVDHSLPQIYKLNKALVVSMKTSQTSHPIPKPQPLVLGRESLQIQKARENIDQRLSSVYKRENALETEVSASQDVHALEVASLYCALAKATTSRCRSMGRKIHKDLYIECNMIRRLSKLLSRVTKTSPPNVDALLSRNEEFEKRVYRLRLGIYRLASGDLGHSRPRLALDRFALTKVEDTAALRNPTDTSNLGLSPPFDSTSFASITYVDAESEFQNSVKSRDLTMSLGQTIDDYDYRSDSEDRSLINAPAPAIRCRGVFDEQAKISAVATLDKGRPAPGASSPLSEISDSASFSVSESSTYYAYVCLTEVMKDPFANILSDEMTMDIVATSLAVSHQSLKVIPTTLFSGPNELASVGAENSALRFEKQWDTDYATDTMRLCTEGETLSSVKPLDSPRGGAAEGSEADTTSSSVYSPSAHGLDSLCDSNLSSMLSLYFKEESSFSVPRAERPLESQLYEESHFNIFPPGAAINTNDMQCLNSERPIMPPYSSVSTMVGLGIRGVQPIGCKGDKPFACLPSTYTFKPPERRTWVSKGTQKATPKVTLKHRKALANIENCEIEYID